MKILSIGNSFSQDAHRYLHEIAKVNGCDLLTVNICIGGCTLRTHYLKMLDDEATYEYEFNGQKTGLRVSIREVLKSNEWDYVTLQQASHVSFDFASYVPYIESLRDYIKKYAPKTKIYLHQTWAYPAEMSRLNEVGFQSTEEMFREIQKAYNKAAQYIHADGVIPSGKVMLRAYERIHEKLYRDAIHAGFGFGRYLLGLVWFVALYGEKDNFKHLSQFDIPISEDEKDIAYNLCREK